MNTFKITFSNNDTITTGFNGALDDAKEYYLIGRQFNLGLYGEDDMQAVVNVELLN